MVDIVEPKIGETILDPACGTAGFLISAYKYILRHNSSEGKSNGDLLTPDQRKQLAQNICGYDISPDMVRLSLVNMYLHRITEPRIAEYDTLTSDAKWNEYFDVILANPPFMSPKGGIKPHARFSIQSKRSEALFVDYIIEHLTKTGRGAIIVPEGVIFKSDSAFVKLRKMLINDNYLYGVISLPQGVFNPYSGVKTSILLFDKVIARLTDKILFAKVENDGFSLGAQRRPIEGSQLESIASAIKDFRTKIHRNEECASDTIVSLIEKAKIAEHPEYILNNEQYLSQLSNKTQYDVVELSTICEMQRGVVYNKEDEVEDNGYEILRANNISLNNQLDLSDIKMISKKVHISPTQQLHKDDILLCVASGSAVHIGKVAYIINDTQYYFGGFMAAIRCDENQVLPKYLYYLLADTRFKEYLNAAIAGANIKNINKKILGNFKIPLPSTITEQQAIVAELDSYQKIIDAAKTIVDNYKPQIDIDPNWPMVALGEIIKLSSGNGLTSRQIVQGDYPVYGGNGLIGLHNQYFVENPTIVIGRVGAYCGSIHITHPKSWITDNGLYVVNIKRPVLLEYLAIMLKDLNLHQYAKIGGQPSISQSVVYDKQIPLPDINIQKEIVSQLNQEQKYIDNAKELINVFMEKMNKRIAKIWNE
jgi:type I restriction enzyme M protein